MSFFEELKRRNVFRVGIAYGIASWVILQIADLVLENIHAPDWVIQTMMLMVGLGFIAALVIAWAYEMTPEGIKKEADVDRSQSVTGDTSKKLDKVVIGFLIVAIAVLLYRQSGDQTVETPVSTEPAVAESSVPESNSSTADRVSIAVLPFVNMSSDPEQEFFSDGITEEILNRLAKIQGLQVAARTSVFSFKGQNLDIREVAGMLGVSTMLEGSVRRDGEMVRITAQLIRASDGFHLWSETYDRKIESIFAVQDEISTEIASALKVSLGISSTTRSKKSVTTNPEVYDLYLRARALHRKRGDGLLLALELFERALAIDPEFAPAWAGLAHSLNVVPAYVSREELDRIGDADVKSLQAAQKALELDPDLTMALHAMANNLLSQFKWPEAQEYYQRALQQDPDSTDIMEDYGHFLLYSWQTEKARQVADRMIELDPMVPVFRYMAIKVYETLGETEQQDEHIRVGLEINPGFNSIQYLYLQRLLEKGQTNEAHSFVDQMDLQDWTTAGGMHRMIDWISNPDMALDDEMVSAMGFFTEFALVAGRYDIWMEVSWKDENINWEDYLVDQTVLSSVSNEKRFQQLHAIPRTKELIKATHLPEYWREIGWPERCHPLGDDDFVCN